MPDLAQGYSADIVLNAGDSVRVSTTGQATVTSAYGAPAGTTTLNANNQLFGPYGVPAKLRVTAVSGAANYAQPTQVPVTANPATGEFSPPVSGAGVSVLNAGTAGQDSGWVAYIPGMRLAYALDSGSTSTTFTVDMSADGIAPLATLPQAFTGVWSSTTAEITPPIWLSNPQARFIRFSVTGAGGGPLSVVRF